MEDKKNILVVEDEKNIRSLVKMILEEDNYNVIEAENGKNALDMVKLQDFDMIFTDVKMPVMDGLTFLSNLRNIKPDIPVAVLTSFDSAKYAVEALKAGAFTFCTKPVNIDEVKRVTKKGIDLRRFSEDITAIRKYVKKTIAFKIPSNKKYINGLLAELLKLMRGDSINEDLISMIKNAVNEAVINAILHGNDGDEKKYVNLIFELKPDIVNIKVSDEGKGFDHKSKTRIDDSTTISEKTGKGIFIIICNMDRVSYNEKGNVVQMAKKIVVV